MEAQMGLKQPNKNSNVVAITVPDFNLYNKPTVKKKKKKKKQPSWYRYKKRHINQ
jgi:hypothetical protein